MIIVRIVGSICLILGIAVMALDVLVSIDAHHWTPTALARLWARFDPSSFHKVQTSLGDIVFEFWSAVALTAVGALLLILSARANTRA